MKILAVETSCDETSLSLIEASGGLIHPRFKILKNIVSSQVKIHSPFGGVVPNLAKREHIKNLPILMRKILKISNSQFLISKKNPKSNPPAGGQIPNSIDLIAVTVGPGLEPALWPGINFAKELHKSIKHQVSGIRLIGVNHLEGHLYSFLLKQKTVNPKSLFPAIALIISGGHTILLLVKSLTQWKKLGETRDDAAGEAFDKVAKMLNLPYPGGPEIEKLAKIGNPQAIKFPRPMIDQKNYEFSFSGLKTSVLYYLRDHLPSTNNESVANKQIRKFEKYSPFADVAASFQQAAIDVLIAKTLRAAKQFQVKSIILGGGVAINKELQKQFKLAINKLRPKPNWLIPESSFTADNAAMIAAAAYINFLKGKKRRITAQPNLSI